MDRSFFQGGHEVLLAFEDRGGRIRLVRESVENYAVALGLTVGIHVLEIPGMLAACQGQSIGGTFYR